MTIKKEIKINPIWLIKNGNKVPLNKSVYRHMKKKKSFPNDIIGEIEDNIFIFLDLLKNTSEQEFNHNLIWVGVKLYKFCEEKTYEIMNLELLNKHENILLGWVLGKYKFNKYKSSNSAPLKKNLVNVTRKQKLEFEAISLVRNLINIPANDLGPMEIHKNAKKIFVNSCNKNILIKGNKLKKEFPLIYYVGRGSEKNKKPIFSEFSWTKNKKSKKITLIGKGVSFDTGGLNLKVGSGMSLMKKDMGGAANCIGLSKMLIDNNINIDLTLLLPLVENSISEKSMRPSDIIKSRSGIFVEISDTDAEGRLILSDALSYACEKKPDLIIDMATLTGASRVALGTDIPSFFTNDELIATKLYQCSVKTGDPLWRLPLWKNYQTQLNSEHADLKNIGNSAFGGAITAALYLEKFVDNSIPWIHVDLMAWNINENLTSYIGGEAMGIRALFKLISDIAEI